MGGGDVNWVSVPGLRGAAARLEAEATRFDRVLSDFWVRVRDTPRDPSVFGDDSSGRQFYEKWNSDFGAWDEGVQSVGINIRMTARGVDAMADAYDSADKDTSRMADDMDRYFRDGVTPVSGGLGGPQITDIPPLTPPDGGGYGGSGGSGGGGTHGRH